MRSSGIGTAGRRLFLRFRQIDPLAQRGDSCAGSTWSISIDSNSRKRLTALAYGGTWMAASVHFTLSRRRPRFGVREHIAATSNLTLCFATAINIVCFRYDSGELAAAAKGGKRPSGGAACPSRHQTKADVHPARGLLSAFCCRIGGKWKFAAEACRL